jgi:putative DNA primase/helicase
VVCFGWGRVRAVAAELRQRDAAARLVLVPDVGKEDNARSIAAEVGADVAAMPEGWPVNADVNDLAQREGFDVLEVLLSRASEPAKPEPRFKLLGRDDLRALPPLEWRVRGVLPAVGVAALFGPSASGKSFLGFDLAAYIAEGRDWFGRRVKAAPVVYLALEGEAGFRLRAEAWEQANGRTLPAGLRLVLQGFKLAGDVPDLAAAVLAAVGAGAVVFVDTLNASAPGMDENGPADAGLILESAKALQRLTAGLVVLVHHTGKDPSKGMRGHSSLFAAMDGAIEVTRDGDRREWKVAKAKDGQDGAGHPFRLDVVDLGEDDEGETVTSCVIAPDESPQDVTRSRLPKGGNQKVVLDALGELLRKSATFGRAGAPPVRPCVQLEPAVEAIAPRLTCEPKRQKERVRQALTGLTASGVVTCREGWLWLP